MIDEPEEDALATDSLAEALARHRIALDAGQAALLERYALLLWDWNEKINLTRHTTWEKFVGRDVVDSLAFSRAIPAEEDVLDVGTGGGVPGIVLAILRSDISVSLCESVAKRARVVEQMVADLGLNVPVHHAGVQHLLADQMYDTLVVRAVAPLPKLLHWLRPHWHQFQRLLVLKGPAWVEERKAARHLGLFDDLSLRKLDAYPLPGTQSESVLLEIRPKEES